MALFSESGSPEANFVLNPEQRKMLKEYIIQLQLQANEKTLIRIK